MRLGIVGGGRAAWIFGNSFLEAGWQVSGVCLRSSSSSRLPELLNAPRLPLKELAAGCDILLLAVPDDSLATVAGEVVSDSPGTLPLFHPSGSHGSSLLSGRGFSLHPLRALPPVGARASLQGTLLVFEGDSEWEPLASQISTRLGAPLAHLSATDKPIYHAAAVFASNYVATMLEAASRTMQSRGLPKDLVEPALGELAQSALDNWSVAAGEGRFTGPVARGDREVVRKHLEVLGFHPTMRESYRDLALLLCEMLLEIDPERQSWQQMVADLRRWPHS